MRPEVYINPQLCPCSYCETSRIQLADAREALSRADKAMNEALNAWRLYLDMTTDAAEAHRGSV